MVPFVVALILLGNGAPLKNATYREHLEAVAFQPFAEARLLVSDNTTAQLARGLWHLPPNAEWSVGAEADIRATIVANTDKVYLQKLFSLKEYRCLRDDVTWTTTHGGIQMYAGKGPPSLPARNMFYFDEQTEIEFTQDVTPIPSPTANDFPEFFYRGVEGLEKFYSPYASYSFEKLCI